MKKKVTMTEIAQELGVSRSLVSYALRDRYGVGEDMRKKIIAKAVEMGYYKTQHATVKMKSIIAVIIGEEFIGEKSFFDRIIKGVEYHAVSKKYIPKIVPMKKEHDVSEIMTEIANLRPQGVLVIRQFDKELAQEFSKLNFPTVFIDLVDPISGCFEVRVNNFGNMFELTENLINKGFRNFVFLGDICWALSFNERYNGFIRACRNNDIKCRSIVGKSQNSNPFDEKTLEKFIQENNDYVIVCASDGIAISTYKIIKDANKSIPNDFSVVGFDDISDAKEVDPPLTTMHIPRFEMGRIAFGLLYDQIKNLNEQTDSSRVVCLNAYYVERKSVKSIDS